MSGKDPELSRLGEILSNARKAYAEAKKSTDSAKAELNEAGSAIQLCNTRITELKAAVDAAYDAMRARRAEGDRDGADAERTRAQGLQEELTSQYDSKKAGFMNLDAARAAFNEALNKQKELRDTVQNAWDAFNQRLAFLKEENAKEQENWKEKPCRICGVPIRYNIKWKHIPNLCKDCYEKDKENWEDRECARCGAKFRVNMTWEHIPSICSNCRKEVKLEKAARASQDKEKAEKQEPVTDEVSAVTAEVLPEQEQVTPEVAAVAVEVLAGQEPAAEPAFTEEAEAEGILAVAEAEFSEDASEPEVDE